MEIEALGFKTKPDANNGVLPKIPYYFGNLERVK